tara:strand:- start:1028 stop:1546 length:519 start_codon:yes stop_codon:yes gene_type:complete
MDKPAKPPFNYAELEQAAEEWGLNCGPGAVAAIMGMTPEEIRPVFAEAGFDAKRYTNPTMMWAVLDALPCTWRKIGKVWPTYGLVRVQWEGPWTAPGFPIRVRYRHTHWIGVAPGEAEPDVFDINTVSAGYYWLSRQYWQQYVVPWILDQCDPMASGAWHITHGVEVVRNPE